MKHLSKILFVLFICIGLRASAANAGLPEKFNDQDHVETSIAPTPIQDVNNAEEVESPLVTSNYKNDPNPTKKSFKKPLVFLPELNDFHFLHFSDPRVGSDIVILICKDLPVLFKKLTI